MRHGTLRQSVRDAFLFTVRHGTLRQSERDAFLFTVRHGTLRQSERDAFLFTVRHGTLRQSERDAWTETQHSYTNSPGVLKLTEPRWKFCTNIAARDWEKFPSKLGKAQHIYRRCFLYFYLFTTYLIPACYQVSSSPITRAPCRSRGYMNSNHFMGQRQVMLMASQTSWKERDITSLFSTVQVP